MLNREICLRCPNYTTIPNSMKHLRRSGLWRCRDRNGAWYQYLHPDDDVQENCIMFLEQTLWETCADVKKVRPFPRENEVGRI